MSTPTLARGAFAVSLASLALCAALTPTRASAQTRPDPHAAESDAQVLALSSTRTPPAFRGPHQMTTEAPAPTNLADPRDESLPSERFRLWVQPGVLFGQAPAATAPDIIQQVFGHRRHLRACLDGIENLRRWHERVDISLVLDRHGNVFSVRVDVPPQSRVDPVCVMVVLGQIRFAAPLETLTLRFPLEFSSSQVNFWRRPRRSGHARSVAPAPPTREARRERALEASR